MLILCARTRTRCQWRPQRTDELYRVSEDLSAAFREALALIGTELSAAGAEVELLEPQLKDPVRLADKASAFGKDDSGGHMVGGVGA